MDRGDLRRLLDAATPRPWCTDEVDAGQISVFGTIFAAESWTEDATWLYDPRDATADDSRLVVAAVNSLPALLDIADAARLLMAMHDQLGPQFQPHDEIELRAALDRLEAR